MHATEFSAYLHTVKYNQTSSSMSAISNSIPLHAISRNGSIATAPCKPLSTSISFFFIIEEFLTSSTHSLSIFWVNFSLTFLLWTRHKKWPLQPMSAMENCSYEPSSKSVAEDWVYDKSYSPKATEYVLNSAISPSTSVSYFPAIIHCESIPM